MKRSFRIVATFSVVFLLQSGCAMVRSSQQANEPSAAVTQLVKTTQSWNGALLPEYPKGKPEITILRIRIPPGARLETHTHPVINAGVLLTGQLTVATADGNVLHLKAGDPIVEVVNMWHRGTNEGKVPAEIIVFYAGTANAPITVVEHR
jgi:quercetin dioxygenase-like cupin family protein